MIVRSVNTRDLTKSELDRIDTNVKEMTVQELRQFRENFDPDEMGFSGRKEGI